MNSKEKEQAARMKALRRELEEKLEEQLPAEMLDPKIRVEVQKIDEGEKLELGRLKQVMEALLFASAKPLTIYEIRKIVKTAAPDELRQVISALKEEYARENRSFELVEIANGY